MSIPIKIYIFSTTSKAQKSASKLQKKCTECKLNEVKWEMRKVWYKREKIPYCTQVITNTKYFRQGRCYSMFISCTCAPSLMPCGKSRRACIIRKPTMACSTLGIILPNTAWDIPATSLVSHLVCWLKVTYTLSESQTVLLIQCHFCLTECQVVFAVFGFMLSACCVHVGVT